MNFNACMLVLLFSAFFRVEADLLLLENGCYPCACSFLCIVNCIVVCVCTFMSCMIGYTIVGVD